MIYPWLEPDWQQLAAYIGQQRIPQALLISARSGIGASELAQQYAAALLCESPLENAVPCGRCHACTLYQAGTHPDYIDIRPEAEGKVIGIAVIRRLIETLALKPQFPGQRVVLFHQADALNISAANAFLKCLEEPAERTSIILLAEQPARLPATIRSRCQILSTKRNIEVQALTWLARHNVNDGRELLQIARGAPLLALEYAQNNIRDEWQMHLDEWMQVAAGKTDIVAVAEKWGKFDQVSLRMLLDWLVHWTTDLIRLANDPDCEVLQKNLLQQRAKKLDLQAMFLFYDRLLQCCRLQDSQLNKQLMLEQILFDWSDLNKV